MANIRRSSVIMTGLLVIQLAVAGCILFHVAFGSCRKSPSAQRYNLDSDLFFSWETPKFAYMSNQILLHVMAPLYSPFPSRKLISPGIIFPKISGANTSLLLRLEDVYQVTEGLGHLFIIPTPKRDNVSFVECTDLKQATEFDDKREKAIKVMSSKEDFWMFEFSRYTILGAIAMLKEITSSRRVFEYREPIPSIVWNATQAQDHRLTRSIAVHLRTWERSVSLNISDVCSTIPWYHPLKYWYACYTEFDLIVNCIENAQTSPTQPIYIATDNRQHKVVGQLEDKYKDRVFFLQDLVDFGAVDYAQTSIPRTAFPGLVENELLSEAAVLVGNFWSTYTTIAGVKKGSRVDYFFDPWARFGCVVLLSLLLSAIVSLFYCFIYAIMTRVSKK
jgi:hypothetical protein